MYTRPLGLTIFLIGALGACDSTETSSPETDAGSPPAPDLDAATPAGSANDPASDAGASDSKAAADLFWTTFHNNQYAKIPEVQAALRAAIAEDPSDSDLYTYLAATHFWLIGEYKRDPNPDMAVLQQDFPQAIHLFTQASSLAPDEDHLLGFIGVTTVHAGQLTSNGDLIAKGASSSTSPCIGFRSSTTSTGGPRTTTLRRTARHRERRAASFGRQYEVLPFDATICIACRILLHRFDRKGPVLATSQ